MRVPRVQQPAQRHDVRVNFFSKFRTDSQDAGAAFYAPTAAFVTNQAHGSTHLTGLLVCLQASMAAKGVQTSQLMTSSTTLTTWACWQWRARMTGWKRCCLQVAAVTSHVDMSGNQGVVWGGLVRHKTLP